MSASLERIAAKLAEECIRVMDETGDEQFFMRVAESIGTSSQTLEEAFLTEIRIRLAARKAMRMIKSAGKPSGKSSG
ncbi:hypothetical protein OB2597_03599 [Pseudooceanicola batsensis HTCC2597]|uniref:Uncharacterized protein n=1 Tax=Pseudooceanicola batsensis (strain ATCC BAA-863 / DSM 15984 / KCTC 12145 / HTCC2597) TaxID=252305 RepID=A3U444_PSEBH|nr:hypothetical protein [Pseudooceanicola batsensis]EAQ01091.1 hypothetical protein OB2597_03599 [Pseudooceanicola batsensis HTCC2597]